MEYIENFKDVDNEKSNLQESEEQENDILDTNLCKNSIVQLDTNKSSETSETNIEEPIEPEDLKVIDIVKPIDLYGNEDNPTITESDIEVIRINKSFF